MKKFLLSIALCGTLAAQASEIPEAAPVRAKMSHNIDITAGGGIGSLPARRQAVSRLYMVCRIRLHLVLRSRDGSANGRSAHASRIGCLAHRQLRLAGSAYRRFG